VQEAKTMIESTATTVQNRAQRILCELRIRELWDIILAHPNNQGAIKDLAVCVTLEPSAIILIII
jgi:anaphase-promoting complex subunit 2